MLRRPQRLNVLVKDVLLQFIFRAFLNKHELCWLPYYLERKELFLMTMITIVLLVLDVRHLLMSELPTNLSVHDERQQEVGIFLQHGQRYLN
jgi:hypothetical protein